MTSISLKNTRHFLEGPRCAGYGPPAYLERATVSTTIYKICDEATWRAAERAGVFYGATIDLTDGFIHFSTAAQVAETAARHFAGIDGLLLIAVDADALGAALKWEPSRGGDRFPHLYSPLPVAGPVRWVKPLPWGTDGRHVFPDHVLPEPTP
jgi:uncharacterized protein (DUF952 family)